MYYKYIMKKVKNTHFVVETFNKTPRIDLNSSQQLRRSRSGSLRQSDDKPLSNSCSFSPPERLGPRVLIPLFHVW